MIDEPTEQPMTVPAQTEMSSGGARRMRRHASVLYDPDA